MKRKLTVALLVVLCCACIAGIGISIYFFTGANVPKPNFTAEKRYELVVDAKNGGSVDVTGGKYKEGEEINLKATPDDGYVFVGWYDADGTYLTTSDIYNIKITADTTLIAKFSVKQPDIVGNYSYFDQLQDCSTKFSFTVKCDKDNAEEWLKENLVIVNAAFIGTGYENYDEQYSKDENGKDTGYDEFFKTTVQPEFTVKEVSDGVFEITPKNEYDNGATFVAQIKEEAQEETPVVDFSTGKNTEEEVQESVTFSIEKEETMEIKQKDTEETEIKYLSMATDVYNIDEGDPEIQEDDKIYLYKSHDIKVGDTVCFCSFDANGKPIIDESVFYISCVGVYTQGSYTVIECGVPDPSEIYESIDIYTNQEVDFEELGVEISEETIEEIKYQFLCQDFIPEMLAGIEQSVYNAIENTDYEIEPLAASSLFDKLKVSVKPKISGTSATITITLALNLPIYKNSQQVAKVAFNIVFEKAVSLKLLFNYSIRYWLWIPTGIQYMDFSGRVDATQTVKFEVAVSYDAGSFEKNILDKEAIRQDCLAAFGGKSTVDSNKIKDIFTSNGYSTDSRREVSLFKVNTPNLIALSFEVKFFVDFDIKGSLYYTYTTSTWALGGARYNNGRIETYSGRGGNISSTNSGALILAGEVGIKVGVSAELGVYVNLPILRDNVRAGVGVEAGYYMEFKGYVMRELGVAYYAGGYNESGFFFDAYAYYKLFGISGKPKLFETKWVAYRLGYTDTIMSWTYESKLKDKDYQLILIDKTVDISKLDDFKVNVYTIGSNIVSKPLDVKALGDKLTVTFADGKNIRYENGKFIVADDAPIYFTDVATIKVDSNNVFTNYTEDSYACYLNTIKIKIVFGDEDAYYNSIDNEIQKQFRKLYRNYNENDRENFRSLIDNLMENTIKEGTKEADIYNVFVSTYIDELFNTIKDYRAMNKGREQENKFVGEEAVPFRDTVLWIKGMLKEQEYNKGEIIDTLVGMEGSTVLYNSLVAVQEKENFQDLINKFDLAEKTKADIKEAINEYVADYAKDKVKANKIKDVLYKMLSL